MTLRLIEVTAESAHLDTLRAIADKDSVADCSITTDSEGRCALSMLVGSRGRQRVLDEAQRTLGASDNWRIVVLPVETALSPPRPEEAGVGGAGVGGGAGGRQAALGKTREEMYADVERGARPDADFFLLVVLSTIVAALGLITDNVAVVIGAMVIAPLLGPNLAFILASALGDRRLMGRALRANLIGVALTLALGLLLSQVMAIDVASRELMARTQVGPDGMAIALASGAAAALCLTTGLSSTLVGVMVAVALLPPAATIGLMLGIGEPALALGAALLLAVNVVSVNLAGQIVLLLRGVRPRTWWEKKTARQSVTLNIAVWVVCLAVLGAVLSFRVIT